MDEKDGWVEILRSKMPSHTIINASVSGETSAGGLRRLPALLEQHAIDTLFIELGGNDGLRAYSPQDLKQNLTKMIELAQQKNIHVVISQIHTPPNYGPRYAKKFAQVYHQIAAETGITLIPFFMEQIAPYPELMLRDGIHPNKKAQPKIAEILYPSLSQALGR